VIKLLNHFCDAPHAVGGCFEKVSNIYKTTPCVILWEAFSTSSRDGWQCCLLCTWKEYRQMLYDILWSPQLHLYLVIFFWRKVYVHFLYIEPCACKQTHELVSPLDAEETVADVSVSGWSQPHTSCRTDLCTRHTLLSRQTHNY